MKTLENLKKMKVRVKIPKVSEGYKRQWIKCNKCHMAFYYDYIPYSLSNPITWTPCGHSLGHRDLNATRISEKESKKLLKI
jgi:hypothetical protein